MANTYDKGDLVRCTATFTNAAGAAVDPTTIVFRFKRPDGVVVSYTHGVDDELVKEEETGIYHVDVDPAVHGEWDYRFEGTGAVKAAGELRFTIRRSEF